MTITESQIILLTQDLQSIRTTIDDELACNGLQGYLDGSTEGSGWDNFIIDTIGCLGVILIQYEYESSLT